MTPSTIGGSAEGLRTMTERGFHPQYCLVPWTKFDDESWRNVETNSGLRSLECGYERVILRGRVLRLKPDYRESGLGLFATPKYLNPL